MAVRRAAVMTFALIALAAVVLLILHPWTGGGAGQTVEVKISQMHFDPSDITVRVGQPVTIVLTNDDTLNHQFSIDALNVKTDVIGPNKTVSVTFTPSQPGDYQFICPLPGHAQLGMVGTLHVTP